MDGPGLLHVALELIIKQAYGSRLRIEQMKSGLAIDPSDKSDGFPVRRGCRAAGPSGSGDVGLGLIGRQFQPLDGVDLLVRVLAVLEGLPWADVFRIVKVLSIRRKDGFIDVLLLCGFLGQLHASLRIPLNAASVIHPHFSGSQGSAASEVLSSDDVVSARVPSGPIEQAKAFVGNLGKRSILQSEYPDIVSGQFAFAGAVAGKRDAFPVWAITGLHVPGHS